MKKQITELYAVASKYFYGPDTNPSLMSKRKKLVKDIIKVTMPKAKHEEALEIIKHLC